jgi:uncharacterized protein (DUF1015 family)
MARIEPFKGLRPTRELAEKVASPPYDVLNSNEARELAAGNEFSFLHIIKPEIDLPENVNLYSDEVYERAGENFRRFIEQGVLVQDNKPMFYVYKQIWGDHVQVGLVAGASAQDYQDDIIKKHELTREDKEKDRMRHVRTLNANTGPVFLTYRQKDNIDNLLKQAMQSEAVYDFQSDGVRHQFYLMDDDDLIRSVRGEFAKIDYLYVADGHHRSASGTNIKIEKEQANPNHTGDEEYNFFLTVIFPHNQMKILPYNRVVKDLHNMCKAEFFHRISDHFEWQETTLKAPQKNQEFCMYLDSKWFLLKAKKGSFDDKDAVARLDASILQNNLLDPVLGIENPRKDERIHFVGGIRGTEELERLVDSGDFKVAFSLYPTSIDQLFDVADSGKIMPPKSTWFEPKLKSGLIVHLLD